jgi:hypothetical protein
MPLHAQQSVILIGRQVKECVAKFLRMVELSTA